MPAVARVFSTESTGFSVQIGASSLSPSAVFLQRIAPPIRASGLRINDGAANGSAVHRPSAVSSREQRRRGHARRLCLPQGLHFERPVIWS